MNNNSKKGKAKSTPEYYFETIILQLDRIEAELEIAKSVIFGYSKQAYLLKEKVESIEENRKSN